MRGKPLLTIRRRDSLEMLSGHRAASGCATTKPSASNRTPSVRMSVHVHVLVTVYSTRIRHPYTVKKKLLHCTFLLLRGGSSLLAVSQCKLRDKRSTR